MVIKVFRAPFRMHQMNPIDNIFTTIYQDIITQVRSSLQDVPDKRLVDCALKMEDHIDECIVPIYLIV